MAMVQQMPPPPPPRAVEAAQLLLRCTVKDSLPTCSRQHRPQSRRSLRPSISQHSLMCRGCRPLQMRLLPHILLHDSMIFGGYLVR